MPVMRISALFLVALCLNGDLWGQGRIRFSNEGTALPEQLIYVDEWLNPSALAPGGTGFLVALYFSPDDTDESAFIQVGSAAGFLGTPDQHRGVFLGGNPLVPTSEPGGFGFFQVKGWEAAYGSSYEEAMANVSARVGKSSVFKCDTAAGGERSFNLVESSYTDRPFQGFVIAVPEPSITMIGLGGIVALGLLGRVRKKKV